MNENIENMNKLELFRSYNNSLDDNLLTITKEFDEKYVKAINGLTTLISNYISNSRSYIIALSKVCSTLKNQINYSQFLISEINQKKEKYSQLYDRIEMINNTSKLFDNHLLVMNNNLKIFISEVKKDFKDIKELRIKKWNKIKVIRNIKNDSIYNKSSSRGKIKKNFLEIQDYYSNDKIYSPHKKENIYNNFIQCSNIQKNNNLLDKQINYRKMHFNQSQENFYPNQNKNIFNKKKSSSVIKEKNSRNKNNNLQNSFSSRNNNSTHGKQAEISKNKYNIKKNLTTDYNSTELKLAYKVLEFIFIINNLQLNKINNNPELKNKIETLKNNLMNLTNEVINQNKNKEKYKNNNIINNNFIYNNKKNLDIKDEYDLLYSDQRDDISLKLNNLYEKIEKLKVKNQDLELLIKIKNKENQKLNKMIHNNQMFQSYQGNNSNRINNKSLDKINIKNNNINNINNKYENNTNPFGENSKMDIALLLNKKIEELNISLELIKKEKNKLNNDLILKNKTIKELKEKINILLNNNKIKVLNIDQKNKIHIFIKSKKPKNNIDKNFEEYKNKYSKLEKDKNDLEKELEKEKKKNEKMDTNEIIKLHNKISEYKNKISYYKENYKKPQAENLINNNNIINEKESSNDSNDIGIKENDFDVIKETSKEDIFDSETNNYIDFKNSGINELVKQNKILKQKIVKLQNKIKSNNSSTGIDYEKLINNFTKDIKDKDAKIDYLNNQIEKLKSQIEIKNCKDFNDKNNKGKNIMNEYESKMMFLKEQNNYFQNTLNSFDDKIKYNEKDIELLKNNISNSIKIEYKITKIQFCLISNKLNLKNTNYSPDKYEILCDKFFNNFHWFLLINKKDKATINKDFHKMIWAEKSELINIDNFNKYTSETEEENKNIIKYISKLEEKDDMISKLSYKLNQIEKLNSLEDINSNSGNIKTEKIDTVITKEKYNNLILNIRKLEEEIKILREENTNLKVNINIESKENYNLNGNNQDVEDYNKFEEKLKKGEIQMSENMKKIIKNHFNQNKEQPKDDSMDNNYIQSSMKEDEIQKITKKNEEESESEEEESESSQNPKKDNLINETNKNKAVVILRKQLGRITKLYEELEKRLKKIKNAVKKIFRNINIKEKEKEINKLFEICGFTEEEINEMLLYRD